MKKLLFCLFLLPSILSAQIISEQTDDLSQLAPTISRGVAFMCVNSSDTIDASEFGAIRCGSTRQLMVEAIQSGTWNIGTLTTITNSVTVTATDLDIHNLSSASDSVAVLQATASNLNATVVQATGTNLHTVVDSGTVAISQTTTNNDVDVTTLPNEGQQTAANSISVTPDTDNDAIGATGAAPPGEVIDIAGRTSGADTTGLLTGVTVCTEHVIVNVSTATTTLLITGVANRHVRICSLNLVTTAANGVALIAGTGATCGTSTTGMNGGTTGATGWNFAANGGLTLGSGIGEVMSTKVSGGATGDSVCIVTSAGTQLSGSLAYAIY